MGLLAYNPSDAMPDFDGNGGSAGTPGVGPMEIQQDQDPILYEVNVLGSGSTAGKHGLMTKAIDAAYYLWTRFNLVESLGGITQYNGTQFSVGLPRTITAMTGNTVSPIVCTVATTEGMRAGSKVVVAGCVGNTAANGTWRVQLISSTQFALVGSTGNGTYTASSGTAQFAWSLWELTKQLCDTAALINIANTFSQDQEFSGNIGVGGNANVSGNLTVGGTFAPPVVAPTKYYSAPPVDQSPAYTGSSGGQQWTIGDPGTTVTATVPAPAGQCNQIISPIIRFAGWGNAGGGTQGLLLYVLPHSGSDNPQMTIIFDSAVNTQTFELASGSVLSSTTIFTAGGTAGSGSVTIVWHTGANAWRLVSYSGFSGATLSNLVW